MELTHNFLPHRKCVETPEKHHDRKVGMRSRLSGDIILKQTVYPHFPLSTGPQLHAHTIKFVFFFFTSQMHLINWKIRPHHVLGT